MLEYIFKSAVSLSLLYSLFFVCLSRETFHRFNRVCLLLIMLSSLVLPLLHFTVSEPTVINKAMQVSTAYIINAPIVVTSRSAASSLTWGDVLWSIYLLGTALMILFICYHTLQMIRLTRGGLRHTDEYGNTIILREDAGSPFSAFHRIVMSISDYENHRRSILTHEQEHIRLGHTYDLLLLEAMKALQWFNPFVWFLSYDLIALHEYEADEAVINKGIDAKQYQQLLVLKAVGNRLQPFANNLRRGSLKKRIVMMYQKKSNRWLMLKALFAIPTMGFALYAFATPKALLDMKEVMQKEAMEAPETEHKASVSFSDINPTPLHYVLNGKEVSKDEFCKYATVTIKGRSVTAEATGEGYELQATPRKNAKENFGIDGNVIALSTTDINIKHPDGIALSDTSDDVCLLDGKEISAEQMKKIKKEDIDNITVIKNNEGKRTISKDQLNGREAKGNIIIRTKEKAQQQKGESSVDNAKTDDQTTPKIEKSAEYKGGKAVFFKYISEHMRYPKAAQERGVQSKVLIEFQVETDGTLSHVKADDPNTADQQETNATTITAYAKKNKQEKAAGVSSEQTREAITALEEEAIRLVKSTSGKWYPAETADDKKITTTYSVPFTFRLN